MFKVGDLVRYSYQGREFPDDILLVVGVFSSGTYNLKSFKNNDYAYLSENQLILDSDYRKIKDRKQKIEKICTKLGI